MHPKSILNIIYEDDNIIVLSKPSGIYTIPDRYNKLATNLYDVLGKRYGKIFTVHRLDRDTSGVIVFAKDAASHKNLNEQFEKQKVKKIYHVVVEGIIRDESLDIDIPISAHPVKKGLSMPSARGKESLTKLKVLERYKNATFCEIDLVTGRHHQIRVHCATIGHPLLVDKLYGKHEEFFLSSIKRKFNLKKNTEERAIISRITMHASEIEFEHPKNSNKLHFKAEYPKDFTALLQVLNKYAKIDIQENLISL